MPRRWKVFLLVAFLSLVLDQASKLWARHNLPVIERPGVACKGDVVDKIAAHECFGDAVPVISGYWDWRLSMNPGSAFGLFHSANGARIFLSIVGILAVIGMGWMVRKAKDSQIWLIWALGLVAGGAVGNLIDRIYFGVVTDFTLWHWQDKAEWPVFNVADVVLVIGVGLLLLDVGKDDKKKKKKKPKPEPKPEIPEAKAQLK
ncbi:MAG TPA: signal peptidase II [Kofleriaceae bacterium]|nr:signal peptidase II [Kofleriaceae bacterium]